MISTVIPSMDSIVFILRDEINVSLARDYKLYDLIHIYLDPCSCIIFSSGLVCHLCFSNFSIISIYSYLFMFS